jgi:hypothetical protein
MPTFRITNRKTGRVEAGAGSVVADDALSAYSRAIGLGDDALSDYLIEQVSPNPEPKVFTILRQDHEGRVWEVLTTGDRERALEEIARRGGAGAGSGYSSIEEGVDVNRLESKRRRS